METPVPVADPENTSNLNTTASPAAQSATETRYTCVYFGYGSNLSPRTMKQRCPDSLFIGLARLKGWKWIINETGYANIIPSEADEVYGSLCFLSGRDEAALDESEGVPWLYEKMSLKVERLGVEDWQGDEVEATAYVDVQRTGTGRIEREYVVWVQKAIEDGVKAGMPGEYAEKYLRPWLKEVEGVEEIVKRDIVMVRTVRSGEDAERVPKGFASWSRG